MAAKKTAESPETPATKRKRGARSTVTYRLEVEVDGAFVPVVYGDDTPIIVETLPDAKAVKHLLLHPCKQALVEDDKFRVTKIIQKSPEAMEL